MLDKAELDREEEAIREEARGLDDAARQRFFAACNIELKDPDTYATCAYLFIAGLHHFYLGKWERGLMDIVVSALALVAVVIAAVVHSWALALLAVLAWLGVSAFETYYLFFSQRVVQDHNNKLMRKILERVQTGMA